jgi:tRNA(Ile)-lysidine synthase
VQFVSFVAKLFVVHKFVRNLITEWRRLELPFQNATFVVAVSGGADSVALLLALEELHRTKKLQNRFVIAHFNHKLRGEEADTDEEFVRQLTKSLKTELVLSHAHLPESGNLEQNARVARYEFLRKTAENIDAQGVITAHTQNDQAETFLMNLIRGSGPDGLSGMKTLREMDDATSGTPPATLGTDGTRGTSGTGGYPGQGDRFVESPLLPFASSPLLLVRPLLNWAHRHHTEGYCHDRQVEYRYDSMNEDLNFTRVRIRKLLLPMLEEFNPKIVETLANTARLMQQTPKGAKAEPSASAGESPKIEHDVSADWCNELHVRELKTLPKPDLYSTIRSWLIQKRGNSRGLTLNHIEAVERLALSRKSGRMIELPNGAVVKTKGMLVYTDLKVEKRPSGN